MRPVLFFLAFPLSVAFVSLPTVRAPRYRCRATLTPATLWPSLEPATTLLAKTELVETTALPVALGLVFSLYALALVVFRDAAVDWAVLETGLGGRWDATNQCAPAVCGLTRIGLDHMNVCPIDR